MQSGWRTRAARPSSKTYTASRRCAQSENAIHSTKKQLGARFNSGSGSASSLRNAWLILCSKALERSRKATALGRLGALLDRDDISDDVYQKANAEHDALFDRAFVTPRTMS
jgi:hypothetical protein